MILAALFSTRYLPGNALIDAETNAVSVNARRDIIFASYREDADSQLVSSQFSFPEAISAGSVSAADFFYRTKRAGTVQR